MDALRIVAGIALPCALGMALLLAIQARSRSVAGPGEAAWIAGVGYLAGAFVLTLWMRVLSYAGIRFGLLAIALPLLAITAGLAMLAWRRHGGANLARMGRSFLAAPCSARGARIVWWMAIAWLIVRAVLLGVEVGLRPLFPWDAWIQWATKARVWYELGHLAAFARADAWFAANGALFFDASPEYPPTVPLLQVWSCIALGRWDDALMNWPWLAIAVALVLAVYGGMRRIDCGPGAAIIAAAFVATLPLLDVHVALAGYADMPLAAYYTVAVLAMLAWTKTRQWTDLVLALGLAFACTQVKQPGIGWAATLLPAIVPVLAPKRALRLIGAGFAAGLLGLAVLAQTSPVVMHYRLHLDFDLAWDALARAYFLLGNWHLLFYGVVGAALLAGKRLLEPPLVAMTAIVAAGLLWLGVVFGFTSAGAWVANQTTVNRATLHMAPVLVIAMVSAFAAFARAWTLRWTTRESAPATPALPA